MNFMQIIDIWIEEIFDIIDRRRNCKRNWMRLVINVVNHVGPELSFKVWFQCCCIVILKTMHRRMRQTSDRRATWSRWLSYGGHAPTVVSMTRRYSDVIVCLCLTHTTNNIVWYFYVRWCRPQQTLMHRKIITPR